MQYAVLISSLFFRHDSLMKGEMKVLRARIEAGAVAG